MPTTPHPITEEKIPLTIGHEFSGTVEEVGEDIHDLEVGSRVVIQPIIYDGTCNACKEGLINGSTSPTHSFFVRADREHRGTVSVLACSPQQN